MPDWLTSSLVVMPSMLWIVGGVGLAWALVALPRRDWRDAGLVACLSIGFGLAWLTLWMLILGVAGQNTALIGADGLAGDPLNPMQSRLMQLEGGRDLLRADTILGGTLVIALVGWALVWWRVAQQSAPQSVQRQPLYFDEKMLIALIVGATAARWLVTSLLTFGSWDELWVYGYQGRIYTLLGFIPTDIGYYPQFMPLQYAYAQIINFGEINDYAARAVIVFVQVGSILAAYALGKGLFNRRTGIILAALWALYPHFGYWTRIADLEIPLAYGFTAAAAFFLMAWTADAEAVASRRRYALIAGLFLGVTMWTKPTGGGFILGVVLMMGAEIVRTRFDWRRWYPRFEVAALTGLACLPLGGVWYLRNVLLGHEAITFPPSDWVTRAMRSGAELGWPLLALAVLLAYLYIAPARFRPDWRWVSVGAALIALGVVPTIITPARMAALEWLALGAGVAVMVATLADFAAVNLREDGRRALRRIGWAGLLALPYFITWFHSYSYHYRLSFAIVPLMALPVAVVLGRWFTPERIGGWVRPRRWLYALAVLAVALPGASIALYDEADGWDWLWTRPPEDDYSRAAILSLAQQFREYEAQTGQPPVVIAPGIQRLPFFFIEGDIRITDLPMRTTSIPPEATHFVFGRPDTVDFYARQGIYPDFEGEPLPYQSQWFNALWRENVTLERIEHRDFTYLYTVYTIDPALRFEIPPVDVALADDVRFADFARLVGYSLSGDDLTADAIDLHMVFEVLDTPPDDYFIYVHLVPEGEIMPVTTADGPVRRDEAALSYYATIFWEVGEYVIDRRRLRPPDDIAPDTDYRLRIGFYSQHDGHRAAVTVNGVSAGDGFEWPEVFRAR
ncbi:MAG: phospholipid carrier-dependent glycosyltransferase [Anaerolineaceae bacterium]|nr:MAG: phospholipid carrier-dependent glycosyltransferase [Anaerolineaceae bacterium]